MHLKITGWVANSAGPDQTWGSAESGLGLEYMIEACMSKYLNMVFVCEI